MNKKFILGLLTAILMLNTAMVFAYDRDDLKKRLITCKPTKDYDVGYQTKYQISGLTGPLCIYRIDYSDESQKPDLICKVPLSKMREMATSNPLVVQSLRNKYCVISLIKSPGATTRMYY